MHDFYTALEHINKLVYQPNKFIITIAEGEPQNSEYAAGVFTLSYQSAMKTVRFRVAKITSAKIGQFVTFWEKDYNGINQPFQYNRSPDLLVVTTFKDKNTLGQFVFPKDILLKRNILASDSTQGKMGMRVYPSWDIPISNTAIKTQRWQLNYFFEVELKPKDSLPIEKILALYDW